MTFSILTHPPPPNPELRREDSMTELSLGFMESWIGQSSPLSRVYDTSHVTPRAHCPHFRQCWSFKGSFCSPPLYYIHNHIPSSMNTLTSLPLSFASFSHTSRSIAIKTSSSLFLFPRPDHCPLNSTICIYARTALSSARFLAAQRALASQSILLLAQRHDRVSIDAPVFYELWYVCPVTQPSFLAEMEM